MLSKRRLIKDLQYCWILIFFKHPVYPYGHKERLIVRIELETLMHHMTFQTFSLEYDAIFDELYATIIGEMYTGTT